MNRCAPMELFWRRFNKLMLDKLALSKEHDMLHQENGQLRYFLKQYLDGISVNEEHLAESLPSSSQVPRTCCRSRGGEDDQRMIVLQSMDQVKPVMENRRKRARQRRTIATLSCWPMFTDRVMLYLKCRLAWTATKDNRSLPSLVFYLMSVHLAGSASRPPTGHFSCPVLNGGCRDGLQTNWGALAHRDPDHLSLICDVYGTNRSVLATSRVFGRRKKGSVINQASEVGGDGATAHVTKMLSQNFSDLIVIETRNEDFQLGN
ncbi:unnamed protein product [Protopolystoma xenopodis]|uniref:Uncharacterized protein n=1 Tax=Protopolystoma xenopodis TaxID=117903 RepID=A0A448WI39_9PLAT|nr:unnamed protein product [Protopolystoma xenopodis]